MAWTSEQQEAITKKGSNILVSAGAGSGKTAVLSERVLEYVKAGNSVSNLLILTFTKAAALEMKQRIYQKLKDNGFVSEAKLTLNADITTFDAYSLSLVKKYYYYLNIDPNIGIADQNIIAEEKQKIIEEILEDLYAKEDKRFFKYLEKANLKDDKDFKKIIADLSNKLDLLPDSKAYLKDYFNNYYTKGFLDRLTLEYESLVLKLFNKYLEDLYELKEALVEEDPDLAYEIEGLIYEGSRLKTYEEVKDFLASFKLSSLQRGTSPILKEKKNAVTKSIRDFKDKYLDSFKSKEEIKEDLASYKEELSLIIDINLTLIDKINTYKNKYSYYTYTDIAKMAIELVRDFPDVRNFISQNLKEVLVDEYQDTSDLQELFLSYITNNNLYMVGDIKQSIYRFRNANPYIFKDKYEKYKEGLGGLKIDLTKNFRSRPEVLNSINQIFDTLMTKDYGDANYLEEGRMSYGLTSYDTYKEGSYDTEVLEYEVPENFKYKKEEIEIFACAKKVKELVNNTYTFDNNTIRKTTYSDIAIIVDKSPNFSLFKKIFEYLGIPLSIEKKQDIKDNSLTKTLISLLFVLNGVRTKIYDTKFKHALVSVLRSFICEYKDEEIYDIITNEKYDIPLINDLAKIDSNLDVFDTYYEILASVHIYDKLSLIGNVLDSLTIIDYVANLLLSYNKLGYDLEKSTIFLNDILATDYKMEYTSSLTSSNEVRLMTIHHSKGLEYPYVIFPFLNSKINKDDNKKNCNISQEYGIYLKKSDAYGNKSIVSILENYAEDKKLVSERIRLLYVALTRAREKMILLWEKPEKEVTRDNTETFRDMLVFSKALNKNIVDIDLNTLGLTDLYKQSKMLDLKEKGGFIPQYINLDYHSSVLAKGEISKETTNIVSDDVRYALDLGTSIHEILASLDLKKPDYDLVPQKYQQKIKDMLDLPPFKDIKEAKIYQEYEFYFEADKTYYGIIDLLLEFKDHFVLIDYKLANLDKDEYVRQLGVYYKYLRSITNKKILVYLVSIMRLEVKDLTNEFECLW